jgi:gliding motility-associated-like protein
VDEEPAKGKVYAHSYADFGSPATKDYQINYIVYSGITCTDQRKKTVTINGSPQLTFAQPPPVCNEGSAFFVTQGAETSGLPGTGVYSGSGISSTGLFTPVLAPSGSNTLNYKFTSTAGCTASVDQVINLFPTPVVDAGADAYFLEGSIVILPAVAKGDSLAYLWSPSLYMANNTVLNPAVSPEESITYTLKVTTTHGCSISDAIRLTILKKVKVPNAFSPNGDGINDTWEIPSLPAYPGAEVEVFNRFGQRVYLSYGYSKAWDGKQNGQALPYGTYYWIIRPKNGRAPMNGSVTIIY